MLKGHVFNLQTFTSEAFALFIDKFLNGRSGIAKGCELSKTNSSVTIGEGYFVIKGRLLQIISNETISNIITNGYYSLICEIDLSQTNTSDQLNQAKIKTIYDANSYPALQQQDITDKGTIYQYEFARFRVDGSTIYDFTDKRTFVDIQSIYDVIEADSNALISEIESALADVLDGSSYLLKTGGTITGKLIAEGGIEGDVKGNVVGNITGNVAGNCSGTARQCGEIRK